MADETGNVRVSGKSVLATRHDDDDDYIETHATLKVIIYHYFLLM